MSLVKVKPEDLETAAGNLRNTLLPALLDSAENIRTLIENITSQAEMSGAARDQLVGSWDTLDNANFGGASRNEGAQVPSAINRLATTLDQVAGIIRQSDLDAQSAVNNILGI